LSESGFKEFSIELPEEAKETAKHLLETVGLSDKYDAKPSSLSGGQKQRVAIANSPRQKTCYQKKCKGIKEFSCNFSGKIFLHMILQIRISTFYGQCLKICISLLLILRKLLKIEVNIWAK